MGELSLRCKPSNEDLVVVCLQSIALPLTLHASISQFSCGSPRKSCCKSLHSDLLHVRRLMWSIQSAVRTWDVYFLPKRCPRGNQTLDSAHVFHAAAKMVALGCSGQKACQVPSISAYGRALLYLQFCGAALRPHYCLCGLMQTLCAPFCSLTGSQTVKVP